jgi:crotonobetainyl-CoA:carnitine CoA-transferase CaiB-like acyl-CoA transferase
MDHTAMNPVPNPQAGGKPLDGLKVVDLTTVLMGPFATQTLGDMGADVIKVEAPGGDSVRAIGPARHPGMGPIFLNVNRSKRSLVLDLKNPQGLEALLAVCRDADVLVFNIRPKAMARLGLSYETLAALNPRLIYVGLIGYDQRGPYAARPAYDDLIQGAIGLPSLMHQAGGSRPTYAPLTIADYFCGVTGVSAILGAVVHRERTGRGQEITVPMFETMAQLMLSVHMGGRTFEPAIGPPGYARLLAPQRRPYRTRDGYVCALLYTDKHCEAFFRAVGRPELFTQDPRFANITERTRNIEALYELVEAQMAERTTAEWLELLDGADIPVMRLHDLDSLIDDEHLRQVGLLQEVDHPTEGRLRSVNVPTLWSDSQPGQTRHVPVLGEHSVEVLRESGLSEDAIGLLLKSGGTLDGSRQPAPEPLIA